jgi:hypothetical protein
MSVLWDLFLRQFGQKDWFKIYEKKSGAVKQKEIMITIICKISFKLHVKITCSLNYAW